MYIEQKNQIWHNKTKRGIPIMSRYTYFWQKHYVAFQNCQRYTVDFPPVYGILNENKLLRAQLPRGGYQYTVYCLGIPLSGKTYDVAFHPVLVLEDVCFL